LKGSFCWPKSITPIELVVLYLKKNFCQPSQQNPSISLQIQINGKVYQNHVHDINQLGLYIDAWDKYTYNIEVFGNVVHERAADGFSVASEAGGLLENVRIYNNIAYDNG